MWKVTLNGRELTEGKDYELKAEPDDFRLKLLSAYARGQVRTKIDWHNKTISVEADRDRIGGFIQAIDQQT